MNRNTLDACREIGDAEKLMINNDYISARDKLLKAQKVLPSLNIGSMLALCDILSAASVKIPNCGIDYYWVLQLMPSSTYSDISCRYRKLLSLLQPIKPRFAATELALKLVREAFFVLSDHNKRSAYDLKRSSVWKDYGSFDVQGLFSNGITNKESFFSDQNSSGLKTVSSSHSLGGSTGENVSTQIENSKGKTGFSGNNKKSRKRLEQDFYNFENNRQAEIFEAGQVWASHYQTNGIQNYRYARIDTNLKSAVSVTWLKPVPLTADERRWCDAGLPVACGSFELDPDTTEISSPMAFSHNCSWVSGATEEQFEVYPKRGEVWALYKDWDLDQWVFSPEKVRGNRCMLVEIISDYSKYIGGDAAYLEKVNGFRSVFRRQTNEGNPTIFHIPPYNLYIFSHSIPAYRFMGGEIDGVADGFFELDQMALTKESPKEGNFGFNPHNKQVSLFKSRESKYMKPSWTVDDFSIGQIWAVYCGKDLMPRRYAHINDVISDSELCVTFLESQPILDYEISWKKEDLPIVCGIFKVGGNSFNIDMSQFSHSVKCQRSTTKPFFKIYPLKGEIWAMYDNWSNNWKKSDSESYECQVVEILSDLSEGNEMVIGRLGEVKGCLTFFDRKTYGGVHLTREILKQEMLCFSHRIPAFRVPGIGSYGIPESSWHLEPNALPPTSGN